MTQNPYNVPTADPGKTVPVDPPKADATEPVFDPVKIPKEQKQRTPRKVRSKVVRGDQEQPQQNTLPGPEQPEPVTQQQTELPEPEPVEDQADDTQMLDVPTPAPESAPEPKQRRTRTNTRPRQQQQQQAPERNTDVQAETGRREAQTERRQESQQDDGEMAKEMLEQAKTMNERLATIAAQNTVIVQYLSQMVNEGIKVSWQ